MLAWFDAGPAKHFGAALGAFYIAKIPSDMDKEDKKFANKNEFVAKKMNEQNAQFKLENRLNFYKKAQLGNSFKWALKEAGYPSDETDRLTAHILRQL